jgi:hypothetical protein
MNGCTLLNRVTAPEMPMAPRSTQTPQIPQRKALPISPLIGERRDAKQESPLCDAIGGMRRPLTLALMADRKR